MQEKAGFVPNVFLALAHRPDEFRAFFAYHDALLLRESGLTKGEKEMIIVATSGANGCLYCVVAHGALLRIYEKNPLVADQVAVNYRKADITPRQKAMLDVRDEGLQRLGVDRRCRLRGAARARLQRRGRVGHRRHHRVVRPVQPDGEHDLDATERRVLSDGTIAAHEDMKRLAISNHGLRNSGGIERYALTLVRGMHERGLRPFFIAKSFDRVAARSGLGGTRFACA